MNKLIISLLLTTTFTNHLMCMKRPRQTALDEIMMGSFEDPNFGQNFVDTIVSQRRNQCCIMSITDENYGHMLFQPLQEKVWKRLSPDLTKKIILTHFADTFNSRDTFETAGKHLENMSKACKDDKEFYDHIHSPHTTLTILYNICGTVHPLHFAKKIDTLGMQNYLLKSNILHTGLKINTIDSVKIKELVSAGANPSYMPIDEQPLLYWALDSYDNTKTLLELGANIDAEFENNVHEPRTVLKAALMKKPATRNLAIIKLLLSYNPRDTCLDIALLVNDHEIIQLILQYSK